MVVGEGLLPVDDVPLLGFDGGHGVGHGLDGLLQRGEHERRVEEIMVDHAELFAALAEMGFDGYATDECAVPQEGPDGDEQVARKEYDALSESLARARGN